jgi:hypothetical protein
MSNAVRRAAFQSRGFAQVDWKYAHVTGTTHLSCRDHRGARVVKTWWYLERLSPALSLRLAKAMLKRVRELESTTLPHQT